LLEYKKLHRSEACILDLIKNSGKFPSEKLDAVTVTFNPEFSNI
jgi:hypothetical protein